MAFHVIANEHRHVTAAHSRGRVGAVGASAGPILAITAVGGVGAAATSAAWGGAPSLGSSSWHSDGGSIAP